MDVVVFKNGSEVKVVDAADGIPFSKYGQKSSIRTVNRELQ